MRSPLAVIFRNAVTAVFSGIGTLVVVFITRFITGGLRVEKEDEIVGLDNSIHGERAFEMG